MIDVSRLRVKLFGDGADVASIRALAADPRIAGFTTNPTLMRSAGVTDYAAFGKDAVAASAGKPISFEVISDDFAAMAREARALASWGPNVYVKIPVTDTQRHSSAAVIEELAREGVRINVTALMTLAQVKEIAPRLAQSPSAIISVFAGRIADTGRDPMPVMKAAVELLRPYPNIELLWASPRELLNVFQADAVGCHIITATPDLLKKLQLVNKDLDEYSLETVKMFYDDARKSGFVIPVPEVVAAR